MLAPWQESSRCISQAAYLGSQLWQKKEIPADHHLNNNYTIY
jgi:hypothetical protein